jgi:ribosome-binding protein aMBF1 (putative translation factor)
MTRHQLISGDELSSKLNENPDFRKVKRKIRPYYDLVVEIINRRNDLKLSQKELAEKAGTHQSRISKIESAELDVRLSTLIDIAEALETELIINLLPIEESTKYIQVGQTNLETQNIPNIVVTAVNWGTRS